MIPVILVLASFACGFGILLLGTLDGSFGQVLVGALYLCLGTWLCFVPINEEEVVKFVQRSSNRIKNGFENWVRNLYRATKG